jgi:isopentenyl diphosphate isomerase/L-lactate dehydrogenase-like FMN-dependent dehydrogenase
MIKGVFTEEDILLCEKVKPDIVVVSNHGGRIETNKGSSAEFLKNHINRLKQSCSQVWVDGGIRTQNDIKVALYFGADKVLIARPVISALCKGGTNFAAEYLQSLY